MSKGKKRLLFVCLGNICRSPAAEGVMCSLVKRAGRGAEFEIDSAGIGGWHVGQLPDVRMRRWGKRRGYDFSSRARQFVVEDFDRFDCIFVMDEENLYDVRSKARGRDDEAKVELLATYITRHTGARCIPDPYYGGDDDFRLALDLIEDACTNLLASL